MDTINFLIDTYNFPLLTAFLVGILTSLSPCPLATNITAIAYISKEMKSAKHTLLNGLYYTMGRGISYTVLAILIYFGLSAFNISGIFQGWGDKLLGPLLIFIGLVMFDVVKLNLGGKSEKVEKLKVNLASKGYLGSLLLGVIFALAFCPYSGVLFFGLLIPLTLASKEALLLPPLFALGTGLPVIIFSFVLAFSFEKLSKAFSYISKVEKYMRFVIASTFILVGIYYLQYLWLFIQYL